MILEKVTAILKGKRSLRGSEKSYRAKVVSRSRDSGIILAFGILVLYLSLTSPVFLTWRNVQNILNQQAPLMIIAIASTLVIISGNFDISVGAVYALTGVIGTKIVLSSGSVVLGVLASVILGSLLGLLNGLIVTRGRVNSLIGTLASASLIRGAALVVTGGASVLIDSPDYSYLGNGKIGWVKVAVLISVVWVLLFWLLLARTRLGSQIYAVGDNSEAAKLSGVNVDRIRIITLVASGFGAGLGGVIAAARFGAGQADAGLGLEFSVIAAIVVGGTSVLGGQGAIWKTVIGVLFIAVIGNGFVLLGINSTYQQIVQGSIILGAVSLDAWTRKN